MNRFAATAAAVLAGIVLVLPQATMAARQIALPGGVDTLIVPDHTALHYRSTGPHSEIHFTGRFVVTGEFHYGCEYECDAPDRDLTLYVVPDPELQKQLPHWRRRAGEMRVFIRDSARLARVIVPHRKLAALRSRRIEAVTGRTSILLENFTATIECDSASYLATYVRVARLAPGRATRANNFGC